VSNLQFNYTVFIQYYAEFANSTTYPEATLQLYWNEAVTMVSSNTASCGLTPVQRVRAINLMTAHLTRLNTQATQGQVSGLLQGAAIDKINIALTPPPEVNQWQWWLNQTPYGQALLALYQVAAAGGFFVGGYPTTFTLRR